MRRLGLAVASAFLAACVDPKAHFDDFVGRVPDAAEVARIDAPAFDQLPDVTGTFLMAISPVFSPTKPTQYRVRNTLVMNADGTGQVKTAFQPLHKTDRTLVGVETALPAVTVNQAGEFQLMVVDAVTPPEANPINNAEVVSTLTLAGRIESADRFCGDIPQGMITQPLPIDMTGSTWSAIRVADDAIGGALPAPELACPAQTLDAGVDATPVDADTDAT